MVCFALSFKEVGRTEHAHGTDADTEHASLPSCVINNTRKERRSNMQLTDHDNKPLAVSTSNMKSSELPKIKLTASKSNPHIRRSLDPPTLPLARMSSAEGRLRGQRRAKTLETQYFQSNEQQHQRLPNVSSGGLVTKVEKMGWPELFEKRDMWPLKTSQPTRTLGNSLESSLQGVGTPAVDKTTLMVGLTKAEKSQALDKYIEDANREQRDMIEIKARNLCCWLNEQKNL